MHSHHGGEDYKLTTESYKEFPASVSKRESWIIKFLTAAGSANYEKYGLSMGVIYSVVNQKGGVGKTTTAISLAAYISMAGAKTLLIDLDPQSNATSGLGIDRAALKLSTYDVLIDEKPALEAIISTEIANLSLLPATMDLAGADMELTPRISRESCLRSSLEAVRKEFDVILIDAPPSLGLLTLNALVASDSLIIPIQTEYYALEGISQLLNTVELVKKHLNPGLTIAKVILTMYDNRTNLSKQVAADVQAYFKELVSPTIVPRNVRLSEAPSHGKPICLYDPKSQGALAYEAIAKEVLQDGKARTG